MTRQRTAIVEREREGYGVSVPGMPGCWSLGRTEKDLWENAEIREIELTVWIRPGYLVSTTLIR